jgi:hypothetical protein
MGARHQEPEFREAARARAAAQWTPDARAAHGTLTREKMARWREQRLSDLLIEAWRKSDNAVRAQFRVLIEKRGAS